jgi:regulatory protein
MPGADDPFEQLAPSADASPDRKRPRGNPPSLKARAVGFLSRREHSRLELQRKLAPYADDAAQLESVLNQLERDNWLSDTRFAQALVNRRATQRGTARILQELRQHGLSDDQLAELSSGLKETETDRAREVWKKKFNARPQTPKEYAKQYRFLASRGFSAGCLHQILGDLDDSQGSD